MSTSLQILWTEGVRVTDLTGYTDRTGFAAVTLVMVGLLVLGLLFTPAILVFAVWLVPFTFSHARRLNDNGFPPIASHLLLWPITGFTMFLIFTLLFAGPEGLLPEMEISDEDMVLIGYTMGIWLVFMMLGYALTNIHALLLIALAALVYLGAFVLTLIGLFGRRRIPAPMPSTGPAPAQHEGGFDG